MKTLKVKINLNANQKLILETLSNEHRLLYNHLLNYLRTNNLNFRELNNQYVLYRNTNKLTISSKSAQNTCCNLINSIKSYLTLKKKDKTAKFPYKFKSYKYFTTFMYDSNNMHGGFDLKNNNLIINLLNCKKNTKKLIIKLPNICSLITNENIKTLIFKKEYNNYFICFTYANPIINKELNDNFLSIDPGLKNIATGFTNLNQYFKIKNKTFKSLEKQISNCQSKLSFKTKCSKKHNKLNKKFIKLSKKLSSCNKDFQHKVSKSIINYCNQNKITKIIVGNIQTKSLTKAVNNMKISNKAKTSLNKSEQNRGTLSRFLGFMQYKSINEGIDFYRQNESYTSKTNCLTNKLIENIDLSIRTIKLLDDLFIDRDLNGSINIAKKAKVTWFNQINLEENLRNINRMYLVYN